MAEESEQITIPPDGKSPEEQPAWRQDFPIDWPQDHYVARRDFTKFMVLTSLAFAVGQVWIGAKSFLRRRRGSISGAPARMRVASLAALPVGSSLVFHYPGEHDNCIMVRPDEQTLVAYSQKCTHLATPVEPQVDRKCLHCPAHHGEFDLATGRARLPAPPRRPLPRIVLEVVGDEIYATGVEVRTT